MKKAQCIFCAPDFFSCVLGCFIKVEFLAKFGQKCWFSPFLPFSLAETVTAGTISASMHDITTSWLLWKKLAVKGHVRSRHGDTLNIQLLKKLHFCCFLTKLFDVLKCFFIYILALIQWIIHCTPCLMRICTHRSS